MSLISTSVKSSVSRSVSDAAIKTLVKKAGAKAITEAEIKDFAASQAKVWGTLSGVLSQSGEYAGKRFKGAKDHTPAANLETLAVAVATGLMPEIVK